MPSPAIDERPLTALERALRHHRGPLIVLLILVPVACWAWIVLMARDMYGPMTGASAWMMTRRWDARHVLLLWLMWVAMMAGMMLPSASPLLLMYGVAARRHSDAVAARQTYALASGYLAVWALFSVAATTAQFTLSTQLALSPMMTLTSPRAGALLLIVAGVYQLTPLKRVCLHKCQSPLAFLMHHWRGGASGAWRMGFEHGVYCLGCCWPLMLLLFVGGVMNLTIIAALTALVALEKLTPFGIYTARVIGVLLVGAGAWMLAGM